MSIEENRRRFAEWHDRVTTEHPGGTDEELAELMDDPIVTLSIDVVRNMDVSNLTFILALVSSELFARLGTEVVNKMLVDLTQNEAVQEIGAVVHAGRVIDMGGTPAEFEDDDDQVLTSEDIMSDEGTTE
jgi:hypothetical protein